MGMSSCEPLKGLHPVTQARRKHTPLEQHQPDDGQITASAKAAPKAGDFVYRQRRDGSLGSLHAQAGDGWPRTADAENGLPPEERSERRAKRLRGSGGEETTQGTLGDPDMFVDGVGGRARLLVCYIAQVVEQRGIGESLPGHFLGGMTLNPPADEVGQRERVTA